MSYLWKLFIPAAACLCIAIVSISVINNGSAVHKADGNGGLSIKTQDYSSGYAAGVEEAEQIGDYASMIALNGIVYKDTYEVYSGEIKEENMQRSLSYTDGFPVNDGEQNFDRQNVGYIIIDSNTVICNVDGDWRVFMAMSEAYSDDAAVDESTYLEARIYSSEILDLQNRISAAMANSELPFVTSSMILENPDRIHVTVNTTDEELIRLISEYNTADVILEIEYAAGYGIEE